MGQWDNGASRGAVPVYRNSDALTPRTWGRDGPDADAENGKLVTVFVSTGNLGCLRSLSYPLGVVLAIEQSGWKRERKRESAEAVL